MPQGPSSWMCQNRMTYTESDVRPADQPRMEKMSKEDFKTQPGEIAVARKNARKTRLHRKGSGSK